MPSRAGNNVIAGRQDFCCLSRIQSPARPHIRPLHPQQTRPCKPLRPKFTSRTDVADSSHPLGFRSRININQLSTTHRGYRGCRQKTLRIGVVDCETTPSGAATEPWHRSSSSSRCRWVLVWNQGCDVTTVSTINSRRISHPCFPFELLSGSAKHFARPPLSNMKGDASAHLASLQWGLCDRLSSASRPSLCEGATASFLPLRDF